ncbi:MAG: hypothetical protein FWE53_03050 [Firmicutes bacterium]|nr:hypothetical protein [Bacillota bacterium]
MSENEVFQWIKDLHKLWMAKCIDNIVELFDANCQYWETPYQQIVGLANIRNQWNEIRNWQDMQVDYEILAIKDNYAIVNFLLRTSQYEQDIINEFKFAGEKCVYLKQWFIQK